MPGGTDVTDGRTARSERTREAVVDALLALLREGTLRPTATEVAERAGVSLRSVYVHFRDREDLFLAASRRQVQWLSALIDPLPGPDAPLPERVTAFAAVRARLNEANAPVHRAAALEAARSSALAAGQRRSERFDRDWVDRVFAPELDALGADARARAVAAIDLVSCGASWERLRHAHALTPAQAEAVVAQAIDALLAAWSRAA
jgi:AcrR family transcriptional regulator